MTTDERFQALEKSVKRQRAVITAFVFIAAALAVTAAAPQNRDVEFGTVTAKALVIENAPGEMFALITGYDHGGFLAIYNNDRKPVAGIKADEAGGRLSIWNKAGETVAGLSAAENGGDLSIFNNAGKNVALMNAEENGGYISTHDNNGETAGIFYAGGNGGWMSLFNKTGEEVVQTYADDKGEGYISVWNQDGLGRIAAEAVSPQAQPAISSALESRLAELESRMTQQMQAPPVTPDASELESRLAVLESRMSETLTSVQAAQTASADAQARIAGLEGKVNQPAQTPDVDLNVTNTVNQEQLAGLENRLSTLQNMVQADDDLEAALEARLVALEGRVTETMASVQAAQTAQIALQTRMAGFEDERSRPVPTPTPEAISIDSAVGERIALLESRVTEIYDDRLLALENRLAALNVEPAGSAPANGTGSADQISTRALNIVNADGRTIISLRGDENGGYLSVHNKSGVMVAGLRTSRRGGDLAIYNNDGLGAALISVEENGGYLSTKNNEGATAGAFYSGKNGGWISLMNHGGDEVVQTYADDNSEGYVGVWNKDGRGRTLRPR